MNDIPMKQCTKCKRHLPTSPEFFYRRRISKDGFAYRCRECAKAESKFQRVKHATHITEYRKQYYANNKAVLREKRRLADMQDGGEKRRAQNRKSRMKHLDAYRESERRSRLKYPDTGRACTLRKRARRKELPATLTKNEWVYALEYFNNCCAACGRQLNDLFNQRAAHADHWIPLNSPDCPGTVATNIVPLCGGIDGCNQTKSDKDPAQWLNERFGARQAKTILRRIDNYFEHLLSPDSPNLS
jgi:hypothetical protein